MKPEGWTPTAPVRDYTANRRADAPKAIDWRYTEAVTAIKNQGQCGSCCKRLSGALALPPAWRSPASRPSLLSLSHPLPSPSLAHPHPLLHPRPGAFSATEAVESQLVLSSGSKLRLELSPQQITSCTPDTGTYGSLGCNGGFTEGAYQYLTTVPGLTNSFYVPYAQSLTAASATMACPTSKIAAMDGELEQLSGGYAAVSGYHYAVSPCVSGGCTKQDLTKLQAALETTPVSVCVNAGAWNDYTGGVMTSAACGSMAADAQDHCVMATGFNTTAPTPYWIVRNSWASTWGEDGYVYLEMAKNTCGLADDVTIPEVALDLSDNEKKEAAVRREQIYQKAIQAH